MPTDVNQTEPLPLADADIDQIERLLAQLPAPLEPLDVSALDGYLCGSLLLAAPLRPEQWQPGVLDIEARPVPAGPVGQRLLELAGRRRLDLDRAIQARRWFDPWVFELDDPSLSPAQQVQPWASGLTLALERFAGGPSPAHPQAREPLAVLYSLFDPEDLEDLDDLLPVIETLEPPRDLQEAVEDLVRSVLLLADVVRPRLRRPPPRRRRPA